jgi:hypothetical protein
LSPWCAPSLLLLSDGRGQEGNGTEKPIVVSFYRN